MGKRLDSFINTKLHLKNQSKPKGAGRPIPCSKLSPQFSPGTTLALLQAHPRLSHYGWSQEEPHRK